MPYSFGGAHLALSNLLCLAGAVLGGAGAWALKRHGTDLFANEKGAPDWLVGAPRPQPPPKQPAAWILLGLRTCVAASQPVNKTGAAALD